MSKSSLALALLCGLVAAVWVCEACNEKMCGSRVSKCQLIASCECDMTDKKNCSCCKKCQRCLAEDYLECCSCVGLCPKPEPEETLQKTSTVEDLSDPIPELFNVLTEEEDHLHRWATFRYPVYYDTLYSRHANKPGTQHGGGGSSSPMQQDTTGRFNCTVAFMSKCMTGHRCHQSCKSMGAARYRWFHEGCCQCIGDTCVDYGLGEPRCLECKSAEEEAGMGNGAGLKNDIDGEESEEDGAELTGKGGVAEMEVDDKLVEEVGGVRGGVEQDVSNN